MLKIKTGDKIKVVSGKDKGCEGTVERLFPKEANVLVPDINLYKKHIKGQQGQKGGIYDIPRQLSLSTVVLICPNCKKATRVGFRIDADEKVRVCKECGKLIDKK